jgi:hypothetical protein
MIPKIPSSGIWAAYAVHTLAVMAAIFISGYFPDHAPGGFINPLIGPESYMADKLIKWDAHWYTYVAEEGYTAQSIVFFPMIIILIKGLAAFGISYAKAGLLVCNIFAAFSFWALYRLFTLDNSRNVAFRAILVYGLMPTSFFLNSIYTEPIFITFAAGCLYCGRKGCWWLSGFFAALATLTRNIGIMLMVPMVIEIAAQPGHIRRKRNYLPLLLPAAALLCFMYYNYLLIGDPLGFVYAQAGWGRQFGLPWTSIWNNMVMSAMPIADWEPGRFLDTLTVVLALAGLLMLTFLSKYRIRTSYLTVAWIWFLIPLFSTSSYFPLYSLSRFILVLFPLYIIIAKLSNTYYYIVMASSILLLLCTAWFVNWYWVG